MFALGIKGALTFLIPQLVMDGYKYLSTSTEAMEIKPPIRKKSDTTKVTQQMYDFIRSEFVAWRNTDFTRLSSGILCSDHTTFCNHLNFELRLNKSRSSLAKYYNGHVNRDDLPPGIGSGSGGVSA